MKLQDLLQGLEITAASADMATDVSGVSYDSRTVKPGEVFTALSGYAADGHRFIPQALERGAGVIICQKPPEQWGMSGEIPPYVQVADSRRALAVIGANFFDHPADHMTMIGITGTNGKTSSTYLLKAVLEHRPGVKVGLIGTNQNMIGAEILPTERTTPESFELQGLFARMYREGCTHVVMEVSSHALYLDRVYGVNYETAVFTNLTQDHLDFHHTMEEYCDAKSILFRQCAKGVVNADDPWTARLVKDASCTLFTYGAAFPGHHAEAETHSGIQDAPLFPGYVETRSVPDLSASVPVPDLSAQDIELTADHIAFTAVTKNACVPVQVNIPGAFMVYNTLDVLAAALTLGIPLEESAEVLRTVPHVKGRVEVVPTPGTDYTVLIDYAHSPDGLENVLKSVKGFAKGRTVALFGCGGDRDKTKRPKMGKIAADIADFVIVTTDNPRTENPADIIKDILPGLEGTSTPYVTVENRVEAIHYALDHARSGDVIVLCGKGHETYQEIGHVKYHMDEREIVADYFKKGERA